MISNLRSPPEREGARSEKMKKGDLYKLIKNNDYAGALDLLNEYLNSRPKISSPNDVQLYLNKYRCKTVEHFIVLTLNGAHEVINLHVVSRGTVNRCMITPPMIFGPALSDNAVAMILCHNHPSATMAYSDEDLAISKILIEAGYIMRIQVLDHILLTRRGYLSLKEIKPELF
jgi:DNA repair protein RadC